MPVKKKAIRLALQQFRQTGDRTGLLLALSNGQEDGNLLLMLQHELQTTDDPDLREMIDDIMWSITNDQPLLRKPSDEHLSRIEEGAIKAYGRLIREVIPDLHELAGAIFGQAEAEPPVEAVVAAIGLHAEQNAEVFRVSQDSFGEEARYYSINCNTCGGEAGDKGHIVCPNCSRMALHAFAENALRERIQEDIGALPPVERLRIDVQQTIANCIANLEKHVDLDQIPQHVVTAFMNENPGRYGCNDCNYRAVKDCTCAKTVKVPASCKDGWIVKANRPATGDSFYAVLRVGQ